MAEIDERTLTPMAEAAPRYHGDRSTYAPNLMTTTGMHIGRSLPGERLTNSQHAGALQVFLAHDRDLAECERVICGFCDHAQIHPSLMRFGEQATAGRGYWVRGELDHLLELARILVHNRMAAMAPVLMVPPTPDTYTLQSHGRVIVPFREGQFGTPCLSAEEMMWICNILSDNRRMVLEHLDFNGVHIGASDTTDTIQWSLNRIRERYQTTVLHNVGMSHFSSDSINVECYSVVIQ